MNGWFETALLAFADYYVACTFLLVIALIGIRLVTQPISRIAACWTTIAALTLLIPATLMPIWPRIAWEQVIDLPTTATPPVDSTPTILPIAAIENDARNQTTQESIANNASDPTTEPDNNVAHTSPADIDDSLVSNTPLFPTTTNTQPNTLVSPKASVSGGATYAAIIVGGLFLIGIALAFAWMVVGGLLARRLQRQCAPALESYVNSSAIFLWSGDIGGLEIKLLGQIGIVVHAENLDAMEQLV